MTGDWRVSWDAYRYGVRGILLVTARWATGECRYLGALLRGRIMKRMTPPEGKPVITARCPNSVDNEYTTWSYAYQDVYVCQCCGGKARLEYLEVSDDDDRV